jgi:hypothetical protein
MPVNRTEYKTLALLKEGASLPTQLQSSENDSVEFILPNVTVSDTGSYSCVYHQATAPFWASHPSDHLDILVTGIHLHDFEDACLIFLFPTSSLLLSLL